MSRISPMLCLAATLVLGACAHTPVPTGASRVVTSQRIQGAQVPTFVPMALAELADHADDPAYEGRLVSLEASFDRYTFSLAYGKSYHGYRLWDHSGHWLLCQNIYTTTSVYPNATPDTSRDLASAAAARLLDFGTFVPLAGMFHIRSSQASHGGVFSVPPSLDIYTIDGQPTHNYVNL